MASMEMTQNSGRTLSWRSHKSMNHFQNFCCMWRASVHPTPDTDLVSSDILVKTPVPWSINWPCLCSPPFLWTSAVRHLPLLTHIATHSSQLRLSLPHMPTLLIFILCLVFFFFVFFQFKYGKISSKHNGSVKKGVIFATYSSLIGESQSGGKYKTRFKQLLHWCGDDFDGVVSFSSISLAKVQENNRKQRKCHIVLLAPSIKMISPRISFEKSILRYACEAVL